MKDNKVEFKEVVELFVNSTIYDLKRESEVPKINIIFKDEAFKLFYDIMNNPYQAENAWTPDISEDDIEILKNQNYKDTPTIYVKDHIYFFEYLTDIINHYVKLYEKYNDYRSARAFAIKFLKRIWLRLGPTDFNDIEDFLKTQLNFLTNDTFENLKDETIIDNYYGLNVTAKNTIGYSWDEAPLKIEFKIYDNNNKEYHSLPHIFYGIENDTCYIYAIQNDRDRNNIPKINRLLYKLNKNIENPNVHPSMFFSLNLFINILKEYGINKIKVPTLQVLSYGYHEILSENEKNNFAKKYNKDFFNDLKYFSEDTQQYKLEEYERAKMWYEHIVDKQDLISKLKTENLINLVYRILETDEDLKLISDIDINDSLIIKINNKCLKKQQN